MLLVVWLCFLSLIGRRPTYTTFLFCVFDFIVPPEKCCLALSPETQFKDGKQTRQPTTKLWKCKTFQLQTEPICKAYIESAKETSIEQLINGKFTLLIVFLIWTGPTPMHFASVAHYLPVCVVKKSHCTPENRKHGIDSQHKSDVGSFSLIVCCDFVSVSWCFWHLTKKRKKTHDKIHQKTIYFYEAHFWCVCASTCLAFFRRSFGAPEKEHSDSRRDTHRKKNVFANARL